MLSEKAARGIRVATGAKSVAVSDVDGIIREAIHCDINGELTSRYRRNTPQLFHPF